MKDDQSYQFDLTNDPAELEALQRQLQNTLQADGIRLRVISPLNVAIMQPTVMVDAPARLDGINSGDFGAFLIRLIESGASRLILDLSALDYLSSAGVRALLLAHKALVARQGKMALLGCRPSVHEVLHICGLDTFAPRVESIEAARLVVRRR